jgi:hypothetical protein
MHPHTTCLLLLLLLLLVSTTTTTTTTTQIRYRNYFFKGVESTCELNYGWLKDTKPLFDVLPPLHSWCTHQNRFAHRMRVLNDHEAIPFRDGFCSDCFVCDGNLTTTDNTTCYSVIAIRTQNGANTRDGTTGLYVHLADGRLYRYSMNSPQLFKIYNLIQNKYKDSTMRAIFFNMLSQDSMVTLGKNVTNYSFRILTLQGFFENLQYLDANTFANVMDMQSFIYNDADYTMLYTRDSDNNLFIQFFRRSVNGIFAKAVPTSRWNITISDEYQDSPLRVMHLVHYGNFNGEFVSFNPLRSVEQTGTAVHGIIQTHLIVISDAHQIRIFQFLDEDMHIHMNVTNIQNTFYVSENNITAVSVFSDSIRRPLDVSDVSQFKCGKTQLQTSQSLYLTIGVVDDQNNASVIVQMIPEFSSIDYSAPQSQGNPANRPSNFNCRPGTYLDKSNQCLDPPSHSLYDPDRPKLKIKSFKSAFLDAPSFYRGGLWFKNNTLLPEALCPVYNSFAPFGTKELMIAECLLSIRNAECEFDMFNGVMSGSQNFTPADAFFYQFFKTQIFALREDQSFLVLTHSFLFDSTFGNFTLTKTNVLNTGSNITDYHVSPNGQHIFASITKNSLELQGSKRYRQICEDLQIHPDDVFLKNFKFMCDNYPSNSIARVSIADFALVSSSCPDQMFCPGFYETQIIEEIYDMRPGEYIERSFIMDRCQLGDYCLNGMKITCPKGTSCGNVHLTAPEKCTEDNNDYRNGVSCFRSGIQIPDIVLNHGFVSPTPVCIVFYYTVWRY